MKNQMQPKDELLIKVLKRNNNLEYLDLSPFYNFILKHKKIIDKDYNYTLKEQLIMDALQSDEILKRFNIDKYIDIIYFRKEVKEARDVLIVDAVHARPALDNIDLSNSLKSSLSNRAIRSLKEELLLVITGCNKHLSDLSILEIQKSSLNNKKKEIEML